MNVLRVIGSMDPASGGPCQGIRNAIPALEKRGVHNEVVCFDEPGAAFLGKDAFAIHTLGPGKGPWNYSARLVPWLMENFHRFDAVIVHGLWLYHGYGVKKALKRYRITQRQSGGKVPKFFVMPHGMLDPYFQKATNRKLKAIRNWAYWKLIEGSIINGADGVLFTCEAELQLAREPFRPYVPKREINVGYGIPEPPLYTATMQQAFLERYPGLSNSRYILFLSRIHEKKGVDMLVKAYAAIRARLSRADKDLSHKAFIEEIPKLVIAGPGLETSYGEYIQKLAAESEDLKSSIVFPGMLTHEAKWGAFYGCDAFILPSHQENFGIAVVEALACSKPVLITQQVNIWREIQAAGGGLVAGDTAAGITKLLEDWLALPADQQLILSKQARLTFEQYFAIQPNVARFHEALCIDE